MSWVEGALATATEALGVATISWMGTRMHWLSASDSFRSLCAWFQERFGVLGSTAAGAVGRNTSDLGAVFEFKDADPLVSVRIGPMKAEQAMAQFFRDKSPSRYPEQFLFVDVDRVWANETLDSSKAIASWKQRVNELAALGDGLARAVAAS